jgi:hypothetical protein
LFPSPEARGNKGAVRCRERLGGLLKYYDREAAQRLTGQPAMGSRSGGTVFVSFCLLSPGLVLFLYGVDHVSERIGLTAFFVALVLLTVFIRTANMKGDDALIDLQLFRGKDFSASVLTQFTLNEI